MYFVGTSLRTWYPEAAFSDAGYALGYAIERSIRQDEEIVIYQDVENILAKYRGGCRVIEIKPLNRD